MYFVLLLKVLSSMFECISNNILTFSKQNPDMIDSYVKTHIRAFSQSTANYVSTIISLLYYYFIKIFAKIYAVIL